MEAADTEKISEFKGITTRMELAAYLGCKYNHIIYNLFVIHPEKRYSTFQIPKKSGGTREICAPVTGLKIVQKRLASVLNKTVPQKYCAHGYVPGRSIKTNASVHRRKRIIINIDLKDFFGSVNFGRVRGLFGSYPFGFNDEVATFLAQICCHDGVLPQGAPTSPVISNCICRRLDNGLIAFARKYKLCYTRYADDITFSTGLRSLPAGVGKIRRHKLSLSEELTEIIESNGFHINEAKVRYATRENRQEVTGLIVNQGINVPRKYVRRIRCMLHAWDRYGLAAAAKEHFSKFNYRHRSPDNPEESFKRELIGMISYVGYIKGRGDRVYASLYQKTKQLNNDIRLSPPTAESVPDNVPIVYCEGKTDPIHLERALRSLKSEGKYSGLDIHFHKWPKGYDINNESLYELCRTRPLAKRDTRVEIYLFDRDVPKYNKIASSEDACYRQWGKNVFSAILPVPEHRDFDEICIEHFYSDTDLAKEDEDGRRLYTTAEFDPDTGNLRTDSRIYFAGNRSRLRSRYPKIIDCDVLTQDKGKSVALSKNNFAWKISDGKGNFKDIDFSHFAAIFNMFQEIIAAGGTVSESGPVEA